MESKNYELGLKIQKLLQDNNLENPMINEVVAKWSDPTYISVIQDKLSDFLKALGFDLSDTSIANTPRRVVKFFIKELFYGLDYRNFPKISLALNTFKYHTPLISQAIVVNSTCEHHLVSIRGQAVIAYIPKDKVVGLSKLNRVVDFFASRPQVQERMTRQIFIVLQYILETEDVAVAINASHNCIVIRGVKDTDSKTLTIELGGQFLSDTILKDNFYQLASN